MKPTFTAEFFRQNREKLRTLFKGTAPIVLTGNGLMQRSGDTPFPFRQDSSFWYLTGLNEPDLTLVIDKAKEYIIVPDRDQFKQAFDGAIDFQQFTDISGIETIYAEKPGWKKLESRLKKVQHIATLAASPAYVEWHDMYTNPARATLLERIKAVSGTAELLDLRPHLLKMRSIKQPAEIECMEYAIDVTAKTMGDIAKDFSKYKYEYEIEADLTSGFRKQGLHHAFPPIVASGKATSMIHHQTNNNSLADARVLYMDIGAECDYYAADLTRTFFLQDPTARERKVYDAVLESYQYGLSLIQPGANLREVEDKAEHFIGEKLRELGLIKSIEHDTVRTFFPHRQSHYLGLDCHDVGDYEGVLQPGMVLTVEPGIYIPDESLGVRIEDDVLVTETGHRVLGKNLPSVIK